MAPARDIVLHHRELLAFATSLFQARGMAPDDARTIADVLVWADMRGVGSHGTTRLPMYLERITRGDLVPTARPQIRTALPAALIIDANRAAGPIAMSFTLTHAMAAARKQGACYAIAAGTTHTGAIGYYASQAAEDGFAAIVTSSGPPNMAYYGARSPSASTSPLAIAVPGPGGPVVLDMATAIIGMGRLAQARERGQPIPVASALDRNGEPTTDPAAAAIPLSLGGPKGAAMSLMFECLSSVAAAAPLLSASLEPGAKRRHIHNGMIILIDIAQLRDIAGYSADIARLSEVLKAQPRRDGVTEILMPGERGARQHRDSRANGVAVSSGTWTKLVKTAAALGVTAPSPLS